MLYYRSTLRPDTHPLFSGNAARVAVVALHRRRLDDIASFDQGRVVCERIQNSSVVVRYWNHVGLVDTFASGYRRAVEHRSVCEKVLVHCATRDRDVLLLPLHVGQSEIHPTNVMTVDEVERPLRHVLPLSKTICPSPRPKACPHRCRSVDFECKCVLMCKGCAKPKGVV